MGSFSSKAFTQHDSPRGDLGDRVVEAFQAPMPPLLLGYYDIFRTRGVPRCWMRITRGEWMQASSGAPLRGMRWIDRDIRTGVRAASNVARYHYTSLGFLLHEAGGLACLVGVGWGRTIKSDHDTLRICRRCGLVFGAEGIRPIFRNHLCRFWLVNKMGICLVVWRLRGRSDTDGVVLSVVIDGAYIGGWGEGERRPGVW